MGIEYLYKGGRKLGFALEHFEIDCHAKTIADLGCNVGGFTDCLLQHGAARVHAVDTGYGILAWKLRTDARVEVHERSNAMHWEAPENLDGAVIDVGWTPQIKIIPRVFSLVSPGGFILSLFKPQYEADKREKHKGILPPEAAADRLAARITELEAAGFPPAGQVESALRGGSKGKGNVEYFLLFRP